MSDADQKKAEFVSLVVKNKEGKPVGVIGKDVAAVEWAIQCYNEDVDTDWFIELDLNKRQIKVNKKGRKR